MTDRASPALEAVRAERRASGSALRRLMDELARGAFERGAADSRAVTLLRGRFCLGLKVCCGWSPLVRRMGQG